MTPTKTFQLRTPCCDRSAGRYPWETSGIHRRTRTCPKCKLRYNIIFRFRPDMAPGVPCRQVDWLEIT